MKFMFVFFSYFIFSSLSLNFTTAQAGKFGDPNYERKHAKRIFPKKFKEHPEKSLDKELLDKILDTPAAKEMGFYRKCMLRNNKYWLYQSRSLSNAQQLSSDVEIQFLIEMKFKTPLRYYKWDFKVCNSNNEAYTFSIFLYPYDKMIKLNEEEKEQLCKVSEAIRKVKQVRPKSFSEEYIAEMEQQFGKMYAIPMAVGAIPVIPDATAPAELSEDMILSQLRQRITLNFRPDPKHSLKEALLLKIGYEVSKFWEKNQEIAFTGLRKLIKEEKLMKHIQENLNAETPKNSHVEENSNQHMRDFKRRESLWRIKPPPASLQLIRTKSQPHIQRG